MLWKPQGLKVAGFGVLELIGGLGVCSVSGAQAVGLLCLLLCAVVLYRGLLFASLFSASCRTPVSWVVVCSFALCRASHHRDFAGFG